MNHSAVWIARGSAWLPSCHRHSDSIRMWKGISIRPLRSLNDERRCESLKRRNGLREKFNI